MELLDLCDERGRPLGRAKRRDVVHRDGIWHRAFHCWVVVPQDGEPKLLLQRRSLQKETWPGLWDVSVGGHYRAGEGIEGGLREILEELGLVVRAEDLLHAGWRREEVFYPNGLIEREIQDVFFLWREVRLPELRPGRAEVSAVAMVPVSALRRLGSGDPEPVRARGLQVDSRGRVKGTAHTLYPRDLVPRAGDYYGKAARFAIRHPDAPARVRRRWW